MSAQSSSPSSSSDEGPERNGIRVFLIHGERLPREVIAGALRRAQTFTVLGSSARVGEAIPRLRALGCEVALIDAATGRAERGEAVRELHETIPSCKIVVLGLDATEDIVTAIEAGASGYTTRDSGLEQMERTTVAVNAQETTCSPRVAAAVFARLSELAGLRRRSERWAPGRDVSLTPREQEVLQLLARGLRNKEIARQLKISLPTVKNHVHRILDKLGVNSRREAIQVAYRGGLLASPSLWPVAGPRER